MKYYIRYPLFERCVSVPVDYVIFVQYISCMGLLKLAEKYSNATLEAACKKALTYTASPSYKSIKNILVTCSEKLVTETPDTITTNKARGITRGADYYRR